MENVFVLALENTISNFMQELRLDKKLETGN